MNAHGSRYRRPTAYGSGGIRVRIRNSAYNFYVCITRHDAGLLFCSDSMNNIMIKQDPVMVANHKDEPPDPEDFILQDSLPLFDNRYGTYGTCTRLPYLQLLMGNLNFHGNCRFFH